MRTCVLASTERGQPSRNPSGTLPESFRDPSGIMMTMIMMTKKKKIKMQRMMMMMTMVLMSVCWR
eukprot:7236274-Karenia_brevis.AAC.1